MVWHYIVWYSIYIYNYNIIPRGSKYPIFKASGPKIHTLNGIWDQRP